MIRAIFSPLPALALTLLLVTVALAQSGGTYNLEWNTYDGGGATFSTGGTYSLGGTAGQPDAGELSGGTYSLDGGFWNGAASTPTELVLLSFKGRAEKGTAQLDWVTASEVNTLGFNVWRGATKTDTFAQLNSELIAARNLGGVGETQYTYRDESAVAGKNFYKLETVRANGTSDWSDNVRVNVEGESACGLQAKPTLDAPKDAAKLKKAEVVLRWDAVDCATHYALMLRRESKKGHVVAREKNLSVTEFPSKTLTEGKTYYWRVSACDAGKCLKSKWQSFTIRE